MMIFRGEDGGSAAEEVKGQKLEAKSQNEGGAGC